MPYHPDFTRRALRRCVQIGDLADCRRRSRSDRTADESTANSLGGERMKIIVQFSMGIVLAAGVAAADEVTDWNQVMLQATLTAPATPAPVATRVTAIVQ